MSNQVLRSPEGSVGPNSVDEPKPLKEILNDLSIGSLSELREIYEDQAKPDQRHSDQLAEKINEISKIKEQEKLLELIPQIVMDLTYDRGPNKKMVFTKSQLERLTPRMVSEALKSREGTKEFTNRIGDASLFTEEEVASFVDKPNSYDDSPRNIAANYLERHLEEKTQGSPIKDGKELRAHLDKFLTSLDKQLEEAQAEKELYDDPGVREYREKVIDLVKKHKDEIEKARIPYLDKETGHPIGLSDSTPEKIFEWTMELDPTRHKAAIESAVKELVGRLDQLKNVREIVEKHYGDIIPDKIEKELRRYEIREDLRKNPRETEIYRDKRTKLLKIRFVNKENKYPGGFPYEAFDWEYPFLTYAYVSKTPTKSRSHRPDTDYYMFLKLPGEKGPKHMGTYIRLTSPKAQRYKKGQKVTVNVIARPKKHKNIRSLAGGTTRVRPSCLEIQPTIFQENQAIPDSSRGKVPASIFGLEEADKKFKKDQ